MAEIHIDLKLSVKIPQEGIKINNLLYQLRKFMAQLYFGGININCVVLGPIETPRTKEIFGSLETDPKARFCTKSEKGDRLICPKGYSSLGKTR